MPGLVAGVIPAKAGIQPSSIVLWGALRWDLAVWRMLPGKTGSMWQKWLTTCDSLGRMRDSDVRMALRHKLQCKHAHDRSTRIVEEMGIWSGAVRIDMAVINGQLAGFELKSDSDTLLRLPYQIEIYGKVFDRVTLVVGRKLYAEAIECIPHWWGCVLAEMKNDKVVLQPKRRARRNPGLDAHVLAQLLWKDEAVAILEKRGLAGGRRSKRAAEITDQLVENLSYRQLASHVRDALKARQKLGQLTAREFDVPIDAVANPTGRASR